MKQLLKILFLVALLSVPWVTKAQTHYNIQVGSGTATNNYVPSYGYYNYSYSQSLYTAAEVGIEGTIDALSFQVDHNTLSRNLTIYMAEVGETNLSNAIAESEFYQVFSGAVNFAPGWVTIQLDSVFEYQDTGSLVIAVIDGTGSYNYNRPYFTGTEKDETRSKYVFNDNNTYTLSSALSSSTNFLPNIILGISSYSTYCAAPSNLVVTGIQNDEASFSWTDNGGASAFELVISDTPVTDFDNANSITVYDTFYTVNSLDGNTFYYVYVRAICDGASTSAWSDATTFRSACLGYTSIPYSTGFEELATGEMPNCWQQIAAGSSGAGNFPAAYAWAPNARSSTVYFEFESNNGETEIAALPAMDNLSSLMLTFYASCMNTNFVLEAGVLEDTSFVPVETIQLIPGTNSNWAGSYNLYTVYYSNYTGSGERMALRVTGSGSYTLMMDDLTVDYIPTCPPPSNGSIDSTGNDWVSFSWQENGDASSWEVAYGTGDFVPDDNTTGVTAYDVNYTLSGLNGDSSYVIYVRSNCGGDYSPWLEVGTARPGIYVMTLINDTLYTCGATIFDNGGPEGNYSSSSNNTLVVFPASQDSTLRIWGTINSESNYDMLTIYDGVGTNGTPLYTGSGNGNVGPFVSMSQAFTIQFTSDGSVNNPGYELHTSCVYMSSCVAPIALAVDSVLGDTVWVSWSDTANVNSFAVAYGLAGFNPDTAAVNIVYVNGTSEMLTGLTMGLQYDFYVQSDCGNEQSMWVGPVTATPGYTYTMSATGSDTIHVCGYTIYDDGGESGNYSVNCNSTLVVYPNDATQTLQISGSGYVESNYDHLYIYDGVGTAGNLLYHGQGNFTMPATNSEEGVVTIVFTSDNISQYSGYELNVACVPLPSCPHPSQIAVNNIGTQTAEVSWVERGDATAWILQYDYSNFTPGSNVNTNSIMVTTNPYTLTGLDSGMTYNVYVAAYCNPDTSEYVGTTFTTLASSAAVMPYSCDFEQAGNNGWDLINGTEINRWTVGPSANPGSRSLYISTNDSIYIYNVNSVSTVFASRTLQIDVAGDYAYSFDWNAYGESTYDFMRAALVPVSVQLNPGVYNGWSVTSLPNGSIALDGGNKLNLSNSWTNRTGVVTIPTAGTYNLVFYWRNDFSGGTPPPAAIDNITIAPLSCSSPSNLAITRITSDSVYLSWNDNGAAGPWVVTCGNMTTTEYSTTAAIGGLTAGTQYTFSVATICGSDTSFFISIQATPGSWSMHPNQTDTLYMCGGVIYDDGGANSSYSASQDSYIILRPDMPNNFISVSGTSYTEGTWDYLRIYDGIGTNGTELWSDYGVSGSQAFGPVESQSGPITIYFHSDNSVQNDGFAINVSCISASCRVMNVHADANMVPSSSQLAVTWDNVPEATIYQIEYGDAGFVLGQGQTMTSTTNSAIISGLVSMTSYDIYVRSICNGGDTGSWASVTLTTEMCDNPVIVEDYDTTMAASTSEHLPIGNSYYNKSYVQTIIPASRLAGVTGEINALAFHPTSTQAGDYFTGMSVYLANISEDHFAGNNFFVEDSSHQFVQVIDNADFSYSTTDWQVQVFDSNFVWDGQSNILVAIIRDHGSYENGSMFASHADTVDRCCYKYADYENFNLQYVEGYKTNIVGDLRLINCVAGCFRPSGLNATNVNYNSATLNWTGAAGEFEVAVKLATEAVWPTATPVSGYTYNVSGLVSDKSYQFRVRAICDAEAGLISDWNIGTFTTDALPCLDPSDLHTTSVANTTATLEWTSNGNENQWSIHVWNSATHLEFEAGANPYTITGLSPTIQYYAAVKSICGDGAAESEYSDTIQFTTGNCDQVTDVAVTNIQAHSATISWADAGVDIYEIEYGNLNFSTGMGHTVVVEGGNTTYNLTELIDDHTYSVFVRAKCEEGVYGDWSQKVDFTTLEATGITTANGTSLSVYPNPTNDVTTVSVSGVSGRIVITIVDINGRIVKSDSMECEGGCTKSVEVSGLAQGAYYVRVSGENLNMMKKLIVR